MKIARPDYGFEYATDPVLPAGAIGVDPAGTLKVGDGVTAWSALSGYGESEAEAVAVQVASLADIPYGTPEGRLILVKGAAQTPVLHRRNLARDPKATATASFLAALGGLTAITDWRGSAVRWTRTATGLARVNFLAPSLALSTIHSVRFKVRASTPVSGDVIYRPAASSNSAGQVVFGSHSTPAGESEVVLEGAALSATANSNGSFAFTFAEGAVGQTIDITDIQIEQAATVGAFFYGGTPDTASTDYSWDGTVNASPSKAMRTPYASALYLA